MISSNLLLGNLSYKEMAVSCLCICKDSKYSSFDDSSHIGKEKGKGWGSFFLLKRGSNQIKSRKMRG